MTYTYTPEGIFKSVPETKNLAVKRPEGTFSKEQWIQFAEKFCSDMNVEMASDDAQESPPVKLVDILARELDSWPKGCQYISHDQAVGVFASLEGGGNIKLKVGDHYIADTPKQVVTRAEWQAAVVATNTPKGKDKLYPHQRAAVEAAMSDFADGNVRLGVLIEMGYLKPVRLETPSYDFSAWPPERFDCGLLPSIYVQSFGRAKRHQPVEPKPKSTAQENTEFLEARVKELEAQNIELVKQSWLPNKDAAASRDRIKDLESQLEQLSADNESLSDIVVQLDDNAIQVLMRARDGDGLYFTSKEGQKVSVLRSGS